MVQLLLGSALPVVVVFVFIRRILGRGSANALLAAGLAAGLGTGLSGAGFLVWRHLASQEWFAAYPVVEAAVWALLAVCALRVPWANSATRVEAWSTSHRMLLLAGCAVTLASLGFFILHSVRLPHGEWDAWAIWNLRARFLFRGGDHWEDLFTAVIPHPAYPHLVPGAVARLWVWMGREATLAGVLVAAVFTYAIPVVVVGALARLRGWTAALWGGVLVCAGTPLTIFGVQQVADVPFAFFVLAAVVLMALDASSSERWSFSVPAGAAVGLAGLVKDEGQPFVIGLTLAYVAYIAYRWLLRGEGRSATAAHLVGFATAALPFWLLLWVTLLKAPRSGLAQAFTDAVVVNKVVDVERHLFIVRSFVTVLWGWSAVPFIGAAPFFVAAGILGGWKLESHLRAAFGFAVAALVVMWASYYAAFLVTPYELSWHIGSLQRVMVHIWPTFILAFCLAVSFDPDRTSVAP